MNSRRYMPRPGSVPARAIAWLWSQPSGAEVTTDVLATAAQFERKNATAFLDPAVKGGALMRRSSDARDRLSPVLWQLGPQAPTLAQMQEQQRLHDAQVRPPKPIAKARRAPARSIFEMRPEERRQAMAEPVPEPGSFMADWRKLRGEA